MEPNYQSCLVKNPRKQKVGIKFSRGYNIHKQLLAVERNALRPGARPPNKAASDMLRLSLLHGSRLLALISPRQPVYVVKIIPKGATQVVSTLLARGSRDYRGSLAGLRAQRSPGWGVAERIRQFFCRQSYHTKSGI